MTDRPTIHLRFWTPERIAELEIAWASGISATLIGEPWGLTRSAILGKVFRLCLPKRRVTARKHGGNPAPKRRGPRTPPASPERIHPFSLKRAQDKLASLSLPPEPPSPNGPGITIMDLTDHTCRWMVADKLYCGAPCDLRAGYSLCEWHYRIAYTRVPERRVEKTDRVYVSKYAS